MKKAALVVTFLTASITATLALSTSTRASTHQGLGLGVILGEPTGLTAKLMQGGPHAIDLGVAFSFNSFFLVYADYLYHFHGVFGRQSAFAADLTPYLGAGGVFFVSTQSGRSDGRFYTSGGSTVGLGIRIPIGLEWRPSRPPIGVFAELAPGIGVIPGTFGFLEGGIGIRFYF